MLLKKIIKFIYYFICGIIFMKTSQKPLSSSLKLLCCLFVVFIVGCSSSSNSSSSLVADAGLDQNTTTGSVVYLNGSDSSNINNMSYSWTFVSVPNGSVATLDNSEVANPSFLADLEGSYVLSLVVTNGFNSSQADTVQINVDNSTDITPPELMSWNITSATTIDTSSHAQAITISFRITDDMTGVAMPNISASHSVNNQSTDFAQVSLISGDNLDGTYSATLSVPQGSAPGTWNLTLFPLSDNQGNSQVNFGPGPQFNSTFTVTGDTTVSDTTPPQLLSWDIISGTTVDTSFQAQTVTIEFRITDSQSGAAMPNISASHAPTSQSTGFAQISLILGDSYDGIYSAALTVPQGSAPGTWDIALFPLSDTQGNNNNTFGPPSPFISTFTVSPSSADITPPQLVSWSITSPATINTSLQAQTVTIELRITDDQAGTVMPNISASHTPTSQSTGFAQMSLISGDNLDGTYSAVLTVPQGSAPGTWDIALFPLSDNQGNNNNTFGPGGQYNATFTVQ